MKRLSLILRDERGGEHLTPGLVQRLNIALESAQPGCIATLESQGPSFCRGMDPAVLEGRSDAATALDAFAALLHAIETAPCPVIALVDGPALGGGAGLAAAADIVLASRRAAFGLPEPLFGVIPAMAFPPIARRVGAARARWLALGAATLSASDAWRIGLADEVADDVDAALARCVRRLDRMDACALAAVKAMAAVHVHAPADYRAHAHATFERLLARPETRARIARFAAGEAPWPEEGVP